MPDPKFPRETEEAVWKVLMLIEVVKQAHPELHTLISGEGHGVRVSFDTNECVVLISARHADGTATVVAAIEFDPRNPGAFGTVGVPVPIVTAPPPTDGVWH